MAENFIEWVSLFFKKRIKLFKGNFSHRKFFLFLQRHFGVCFFASLGNEYGVPAEVRFSPRICRYLSFHFSFEYLQFFAIIKPEANFGRGVPVSPIQNFTETVVAELCEEPLDERSGKFSERMESQGNVFNENGGSDFL